MCCGGCEARSVGVSKGDIPRQRSNYTQAIQWQPGELGFAAAECEMLCFADGRPERRVPGVGNARRQGDPEGFCESDGNGRVGVEG